MSDIKLITCTPLELSKDDIDACIDLVVKGWAVSKNFVARWLPKSKLVAVVRDEGEIVAVGVIKGSRPAYATTIAKKSGVAFDVRNYELGYVAVRETHRGQGLSQDITEGLLAAFPNRPLFATTYCQFMKWTLAGSGFVQGGKEWAGTKEKLSLWIKE